MDIILYLLSIIQYLYQQNRWLILFICKYIPLKQWAHDDSHFPKYQKFKTDKLPKMDRHYNDWDWQLLIPYFEFKYHKKIKPVSRRKDCDIPLDCKCPSCNALSHIKDRKHFIVHKCVNPKCPYYLHNIKNVDKQHLDEEYCKNEYKLHYIYREFTVDFFKMDLNSLTKNASSLKFNKFDSHVMSLCLTLRVNLGLSLRKTSQVLKDLYNIQISHQQIANYCKTASLCVKPFVDNYDYSADNTFTADETYSKVRGIKTYIWFIMDAARRSIIGYCVSDNRGVGSCIMAMRMAFRHFKELPKDFRFIAD